ncbi:Thiol-disulfide oxidoreductase ResA [Elizabethkingia miricola]|nr:Thiol-disulfide oxidoreductase ResA [Elizabethkingia miricola]
MNKNKTLKILAITIPVVLISLMVYLFINFQKKKERVESLNQIPSFIVTDIKDNIISQDKLSKGNKVLVYFSPTCHFCQAEAEELSKINSKYPKYTMVVHCQ